MKKQIAILITFILLILSLTNICFATDEDTGYLYTNESGDLTFSGDLDLDEDSTLVDDPDEYYSYDYDSEQEELEGYWNEQKQYILSSDEADVQKLIITKIDSDIEKSYYTDYYNFYLYQYQEIHVKTTDGKEYAAIVVLSEDMPSENKNITALKVGDTIYGSLSIVNKEDSDNYNLLKHNFDDDEIAYIPFPEQDRSLGVFLLLILTILLLVLYAGKHGAKLLIPIFVAIDLLFVVFSPCIKLGLNILMIAILIALELIILISILRNGFSKKALISILSSLIVVVLVCCLACLFINANRLTGKVTESDPLYNSYATQNVLYEIVNTKDLCIAIILIVSAVISSTISSKLTDLAEKYAGTKQMAGSIIEEAKGKLGEYIMIIAILYLIMNLPLFMTLSYDTSNAFLQYINSDSLVTNIMYILLSIISALIVSPITAIISSIFMANVEVKQIEDTKK